MGDILAAALVGRAVESGGCIANANAPMLPSTALRVNPSALVAFVSGPHSGALAASALAAPSDVRTRSAVRGAFARLVGLSRAASTAAGAGSDPIADWLLSALLRDLPLAYAHPQRGEASGALEMALELLGAGASPSPAPPSASSAHTLPSLASSATLPCPLPPGVDALTAATEVAALLRAHPAVETGDSAADPADATLRCLLTLLLRFAAGRVDVCSAAAETVARGGLGLVDELFDGVLFALRSETPEALASVLSPSPLGAALPKAKRNATRGAAFELLVALAAGAGDAAALISTRLLALHEPGEHGGDAALAAARASLVSVAIAERAGSRSIAHVRATDPRNSTGYAGLHNPACLCYLLSMLQQLFMNAAFRSGILRARIDDAELLDAADADSPSPSRDRDLSALLERARADSLALQLQRLFALLQDSARAYAEPLSLAHALKDLDGLATNLSEQKDVPETISKLFTDLETQLQGTAQDNLHKDVFGIQTVSEFFAADPRPGALDPRLSRSRDNEPEDALKLRVRGHKDLDEALRDLVSAETIEYTWEVPRLGAVTEAEADDGGGGGGGGGGGADDRNEKVRIVSTQKRLSIKQTSDALMLHLNRFDFDYDRMEQVKVNDALEFPTVLDVWPYTVWGRDGGVVAEGGGEEGETPPPPRAAFLYHLAGVVVHVGSAAGGHYYSFVRERGVEGPAFGDRWFKFDDDLVTPWDATPEHFSEETFGGIRPLRATSFAAYPREEFKTNNAFCLFYERAAPARAAAAAYAAAKAGAAPDPAPVVPAHGLENAPSGVDGGGGAKPGGGTKPDTPGVELVAATKGRVSVLRAPRDARNAFVAAMHSGGSSGFGSGGGGGLGSGSGGLSGSAHRRSDALRSAVRTPPPAALAAAISADNHALFLAHWTSTPAYGEALAGICVAVSAGVLVTRCGSVATAAELTSFAAVRAVGGSAFPAAWTVMTFLRAACGDAGAAIVSADAAERLLRALPPLLRAAPAAAQWLLVVIAREHAATAALLWERDASSLASRDAVLAGRRFAARILGAAVAALGATADADPRARELLAPSLASTIAWLFEQLAASRLRTDSVVLDTAGSRVTEILFILADALEGGMGGGALRAAALAAAPLPTLLDFFVPPSLRNGPASPPGSGLTLTSSDVSPTIFSNAPPPPPALLSHASATPLSLNASTPALRALFVALAYGDPALTATLSTTPVLWNALAAQVSIAWWSREAMPRVGIAADAALRIGGSAALEALAGVIVRALRSMRHLLVGCTFRLVAAAIEAAPTPAIAASRATRLAAALLEGIRGGAESGDRAPAVAYAATEASFEALTAAARRVDALRVALGAEAMCRHMEWALRWLAQPPPPSNRVSNRDSPDSFDGKFNTRGDRSILPGRFPGVIATKSAEAVDTLSLQVALLSMGRRPQLRRVDFDAIAGEVRGRFFDAFFFNDGQIKLGVFEGEPEHRFGEKPAEPCVVFARYHDNIPVAEPMGRISYRVRPTEAEQEDMDAAAPLVVAIAAQAEAAAAGGVGVGVGVGAAALPLALAPPQPTMPPALPVRGRRVGSPRPRNHAFFAASHNPSTMTINSLSAPLRPHAHPPYASPLASSEAADNPVEEIEVDDCTSEGGAVIGDGEGEGEGDGDGDGRGDDFGNAIYDAIDGNVNDDDSETDDLMLGLHLSEGPAKRNNNQHSNRPPGDA